MTYVPRHLLEYKHARFRAPNSPTYRPRKDSDDAYASRLLNAWQAEVEEIALGGCFWQATVTGIDWAYNLTLVFALCPGWKSFRRTCVPKEDLILVLEEMLLKDIDYTILYRPRHAAPQPSHGRLTLA